MSKRQQSLVYGPSVKRRKTRPYRKMRISKQLRAPTPYGYIYPFERIVEFDSAINLNSGFGAQTGLAGNGPGLGFAFTLDNLRAEFTNGATVDSPISGSSDFTNLFDQWRIDRVDMHIYFNQTNQTLQPSTVNTYAMPVLRVVTDLDNTDVSNTEPIVQYPQCRSFQVGMSQKFSHTVYNPGVVFDAQIDTNPSLASSVRRSPWLDTAVPEVAHFGIKVVYAPWNLSNPDYSPDLVIGACKFEFKIYYSFKLAR